MNAPSLLPILNYVSPPASPGFLRLLHDQISRRQLPPFSKVFPTLQSRLFLFTPSANKLLQHPLQCFVTPHALPRLEGLPSSARSPLLYSLPRSRPFSFKLKEPLPPELHVISSFATSESSGNFRPRKHSAQRAVLLPPPQPFPGCLPPSVPLPFLPDADSVLF